MTKLSDWLASYSWCWFYWFWENRLKV